MLRRLCVVVLALACIALPALPALEHGLEATAESCCGTGACCCKTDCVPAPAPVRTASAPSAVAAATISAARVAPKPCTARNFAFVLSEKKSAPAARVFAARSLAGVTARAPLFAAYCAFLI
jgi:hypothetical protein